MNKFDRHISACEKPGCKAAYETGNVENDKLCPEGRFILETDETKQFKQPQQN